MKEVKKFSDLLDSYISVLNLRMQNKKKNVDIYDLWQEIAENENISSNSYLDNFNNNTIFIHVDHPCIAQQIRMKKKMIIEEFKVKFPNLNIKKINIIIDSVLN